MPPDAIISCEVQQKSQGELSHWSAGLWRHTAGSQNDLVSHVNSFTTLRTRRDHYTTEVAEQNALLCSIESVERTLVCTANRQSS